MSRAYRRRDSELIGELRVACTKVSSRPEFIARLDELVGKPLDNTALAKRLVRRRDKARQGA